MPIILTIETSTKNCSVALFNGDTKLALKEKNSENYSHAEQLTVFIEDVVRCAKIS